MKKLTIGDYVEAKFLGETYECQVIEITDKHRYKIKKIDGTILPNATWHKLLEKKSPWYITKFLKSGKVKVKQKQSIQRIDLEKAIQKQKDFLGGKLKKQPLNVPYNHIYIK